MQNLLDTPGKVREEDALDVAAITEYLQTQLDGLEGLPAVRQFRGGASNLTYQLDFADRSLILRCPPRGTKAKGAHDMSREYKIMRALKPVFPYVPQMLAFCEDTALIGREFYVMEKLEGIILRANLPQGMSLSPEQADKLCERVFSNLLELHHVDLQATGLDAIGKGEGYCQRQIAGWSGRYVKARTWNVPTCAYVMDWLKERIPSEERSCLIHNDYRFDNVVLDAQNPFRVVGVLDWEMATVGDPLMDLGNSLAYWVQPDDDFFFRSVRRQPTHLPGMWSRAQIIRFYCEKAGIEVADFAFYETYGLFRLAVIVQQIYYRYHHKQTRNKAFKNFWLLVNYLNWRCKRIIDRAKR